MVGTDSAIFSFPSFRCRKQMHYSPWPSASLNCCWPQGNHEEGSSTGECKTCPPWSLVWRDLYPGLLLLLASVPTVLSMTISPKATKVRPAILGISSWAGVQLLMLDAARDRFLLRPWLQGEVLLGHCPCYMQVPQISNWGLESQ